MNCLVETEAKPSHRMVLQLENSNLCMRRNQVSNIHQHFQQRDSLIDTICRDQRRTEDNQLGQGQRRWRFSQ